MFVDIEINIFMSFIFALFLFPFLHSNIFNFRHYVIAGKTYRHVPFIEKNVTHSYLHRKLAYFICYCFLYALRNTSASVLRVIRKPSEFKGTYPDAFETSARILPFPWIYEMPVVCL